MRPTEEDLKDRASKARLEPMVSSGFYFERNFLALKLKALSRAHGQENWTESVHQIC